MGSPSDLSFFESYDSRKQSEKKKPLLKKSAILSNALHVASKVSTISL